MNQIATELANKVRVFAELERHTYGWGEALANACACTSYLLMVLLRQKKIKSQMVVGILHPPAPTIRKLDVSDAEHAWVVLENKTILDVTATQYGANYPRVIVAPKGTTFWHKYTPLASGPRAVKEIISGWEWSQEKLTRLHKGWVAKSREFNGKPLTHWKSKADELVMELLLRSALLGVDERSIIGRLAQEKLLEIARTEDLTLYKKTFAKIRGA